MGNPAVVFPQGSIEPLGIITLASNAGSIEFTNIPQTYTHLQVRMFALGNTTTGYDTFMQLNSDTAANYSTHRITGNGTQVLATGYTNQTGMMLVQDAARTLYPSISVTDILDYRNVNKFKTIRTFGGNDQSGSGAIALWSGNWRNKNAITSIKISVGANSFAPDSSFALFGVNA